MAVADGLLTLWIARPTRYDTDPRSVASMRRLAGQHRRQVDLTEQGLERWDLYNPATSALNGSNPVLKQPTFENVLPLGNRLHLTLGSDPLLRRTALGSDRVFFATEALETAPSMSALGALMRATARNGQPVLLVHPRSAMRSLRREPPGQLPADLRARIRDLSPIAPLAHRLVAYRPRELTLEVEAPGEGWLLVTDRWAGGWRAAVNGEPTEVWGANLVFRAVRIGRGHSTVRFLYRPTFLPPLLAVSWGALAVGLVAAVAAASRRQAGGRSRAAGGEGEDGARG